MKTLPEAIARKLEDLSSLEPAMVHRTKVRLASLTLPQAPLEVTRALLTAERYVAGQAQVAELSEARQDIWSYLGTLSCGAGSSDGAIARLAASAVGGTSERHEPSSIAPHVELALLAGVPPAEVSRLLDEART